MKSLRTLIKIHQHKLDELRREMISLESNRSGLEHGIQRLQNELDNEVHLAEKSTELQGYLGQFANRIKERQAMLHEEIIKLEQKMDRLRNDIALAFSEVKKYEIALANAEKREAEEANRKEIIEIGDIAIGQYQRNKDSSDA